MKKQLIIGNIKLDSPVLLAPMTGYTDLPFRMAVRRLGGLGLAYTEMIDPKSVLYGRGQKQKALLATSPDDRPLGWHIFGSDQVLMAEAAQLLVERGAKLIDINMGCPKKKISRRGAGCGLMKNPAVTVKLAKHIINAVKVPVTAKMRLGWDENLMTAVSLAEELEQAGIAAITIHGRTCSKDYSMKANWREIRRVVESVRRIPVIGNGDVISPETACAMFSETGCSGVMIGRMALKAPWIIRDINAVLSGDRPPAYPSKNEQLDFMRRHFEDMVILYGEHIATLLFRRWIPQYTKALHIDHQIMIQLLQVEQVEVLRKKMNELYRNLSNNFSK